MKKLEQSLKLFPAVSFGLFLGRVILGKDDAFAAFVCFLVISAVCGIGLFILHRKKKES